MCAFSSSVLEAPSHFFTAGSTTDSTAIGRPRKRQCLLDIQKTGPDTLQKIHTQLVRWVVNSNGAFSVVEDPEFLKFVHMLRPGAQLPGRKRVGGDLLEQLYQAELARV